ncbi:MAG: alanine--tRNA ligase [Candidatus Woesearchaeota archaeon]
MLTDKELKNEFRKRTEKNPEKFFAVNVLKNEGFKRQQCIKCKKFFWSVECNDICGDAECKGGFNFIQNTPSKNKMEYIELWKTFSNMFKKFGYTPIKRYPVAARWRDDTDFVQASIYDFQPWVVNGTIDPPANPLVIPQFCLRFNDIDNVGITGSHCTGFVMIGQHAFVKKEEWKQDDYFIHIHKWLTQGHKIPKTKIFYHEDGWAGGGNFGPCMEFFSGGLELGNQVYMQYENTPNGEHELNLKVLDMGMGHERNTWFSLGKETLYEATFPDVIKYLKKITNMEEIVEKGFMKKFLPYAALLNINEAENIEKNWKFIATKLNLNVNDLKKKILPLAGMYSIAEHLRSVLFAINDGVLFSNVGGGYNLRSIYRRALSIAEQNKWNIDMGEIVKMHAKYLKPLFPELLENINETINILEYENKKFKESRERNWKIIQGLVEKDIDEKKLIELYDSYGINPEELKSEFEKKHKKISIPENFYSLVVQKHNADKKIHNTQTFKDEKLKLDGLPNTDILYYDHYDLLEFKAKVLKIIDNNVILDRTAFYPTSGGQLHDIGTLNGCNVVNVFKQGNVIIHVMDKVNFKEGQEIKGNIDMDRRQQLAQHHTATHIINGAAKNVLGKHVWQAGASKTLEKARLDITHYDSLTDEQKVKIEILANKIVNDNLPVHKMIIERGVAERKFGFTIYQGGAVPGKLLRIVHIEGIDAEACGGTHLDVTGDVGIIKILKTSKIQDGIVRIEFVAGRAAEMQNIKRSNILIELKKLLDCSENEIPGRAKELFELWKAIIKKKQQKKFELTSIEKYHGDVIEKTCEVLKTQPEYLVKTVQRFINEVKRNN